MAGLSLRDINKSFGFVHVLKSINLEIVDGEFVVLVGPSGCGKSTLLRVIAGLEDATSGALDIGGQDVLDRTPGQRRIAMVFQSYALYPHMSVRKNLSFGLENLRLPKSEIDKRVAEAVRMLGLEPYLDRRPKALSGGQRQRVAIGRAIVREPSVFLFDEPLSNLDAKLRVQTRGEITKLHRTLKSTMIYVTHDQVEAMTMADRIVVMNAGVIEQSGTPLQLFEQPANLFVAGFIGSPKMNLIDVEVAIVSGTDVTLKAALGTVRIALAEGSVSPGDAMVLGVRPSHTSAGTGPFAINVEYQESLGTETFIYGTVPGLEELMTLHVPYHLVAESGSTLAFDLPVEKLHLFRKVDGKRVARLDEIVGGHVQ